MKTLASLVTLLTFNAAFPELLTVIDCWLLEPTVTLPNENEVVERPIMGAAAEKDERSAMPYSPTAVKTPPPEEAATTKLYVPLD